jgi:hypothetical protein
VVAAGLREHCIKHFSPGRFGTRFMFLFSRLWASPNQNYQLWAVPRSSGWRRSYLLAEINHAAQESSQGTTIKPGLRRPN